MIAAIVAVAILFVLLPILGNIGGQGGVTAAKDAISNSLSNVSSGGTITSQAFSLQKGNALTSKNFSDKGFDQHSILFAEDPSIVPSVFEIETDDDFSSFKYTGSVTFQTQAYVICEITGTSLQGTLDRLDLGVDADPESLCGTEGSEGEYAYQPCCLVVLQRAKK